MLLPLNELQGELREFRGKNILREQVRSGKMNMPSISSTFIEEAIGFSPEEAGADEEEAQTCDKNDDTSSELNKRSKVRDNTDNPESDVTILNIDKPPYTIYETSV